MSTIAEMARKAYQQNRSLPLKYQTPDHYWADWFSKGYCKALEHAEERMKAKALEAFCATMHAGPTSCDMNKPGGCKRQCRALEKFTQILQCL